MPAVQEDKKTTRLYWRTRVAPSDVGDAVTLTGQSVTQSPRPKTRQEMVLQKINSEYVLRKDTFKTKPKLNIELDTLTAQYGRDGRYSRLDGNQDI